jgi:hypothetical protein
MVASLSNSQCGDYTTHKPIYQTSRLQTSHTSKGTTTPPKQRTTQSTAATITINHK